MVQKPLCSTSLESWAQMGQLGENSFEIGKFFLRLLAFEYYDVIGRANLPLAATGAASGRNWLTHPNSVLFWPKDNMFQNLAL